MKMRFCISVLLSIICLTSFADETAISAENLKVLKSRPLIVELFELNQAQIDKWTKEKERSNNSAIKSVLNSKIVFYSKMVECYNLNIQKTVAKYFDWHSKIEYMTESEVDELRKKSKNYTVLYPYREPLLESVETGVTKQPNVRRPSLCYSRIEKNQGNPDYVFYQPYEEKALADMYSEHYLSLAFRLMKNHFDYIESMPETKVSFLDFARDQMRKNCSKTPQYKILIMKREIYQGVTPDEIKEAYSSSEIIFCKDAVYYQSILNSADTLAAIMLPYFAGVANSDQYAYVKALVNLNTAEFYYVSNTSIGNFYDCYFRLKNFRDFTKCE